MEKREGKGKKQDKNQKEDKKESSVKIEEVNAVSEAEKGDILFTSTMESLHLVWQPIKVCQMIAVPHFTSIQIVNGLWTMMQGGQVVWDLVMG